MYLVCLEEAYNVKGIDEQFMGAYNRQKNTGVARGKTLFDR